MALKPQDNELRVLPLRRLEEQTDETRWLVKHLLPLSSVGMIGAQPKSAKTWLGLELAIAVASGRPCLGSFPVDKPGSSLVYLAEDSLADLKKRASGICEARGVDMDSLDLHVIAEPALRLDTLVDKERLRQAVDRLRPALLLLDPLVRLHALDENSSREISSLLGFLRELQRSFEVSILLVHHTTKRQTSRPGQSLRGSGDLHAWLDVGAYLAWRHGELWLSLEHRSSPSPEPIRLELRSRPDGSATCLCALDGASAPASQEPSLSDLILRELRASEAPLRRVDLRQKLRVNNSRLGAALEKLEELKIALRTAEGWTVPSSSRSVPSCP